MKFVVTMTNKYGLKEVFYLIAANLIEAGIIAEQWLESEELNKDLKGGVT